MDSETKHHNQSRQNNMLPMVVIGIILLVVGGVGGYYYGKKSTQQKFMGMMKSNTAAMRPTGKGGPNGMRMGMAAVTPPPVSDQQTQQLAAGTDTATTQKTFNITGGNFYFVPNKITVNKGDKVTFVMTNAGGIHDIKIDELGIETPVVKTGVTVAATFTPNKTGSFVYYCDVPGHRTKGMWGTLIVQ